MPIRIGDKVSIHYRTCLADGRQVDSSEHDGPIALVVGDPDLLPGVSQGLVGMARGEQKTLSLSAAEAYGERRDGLDLALPLERLPEGARAGDPVALRDESGVSLAWVQRVDENGAILSLDHPLAGYPLTIAIAVADVEREDEDESEGTGDAP